MQTNIHLQVASAHHAEGIGKVVRDAIRRVNAKDYPADEITRLVNNFSTDSVVEMLKQRVTIVAMADGVVVGTGALQGSEIKSVFVSPDLHRQGVGRRVMAALEQMASQQDVPELTVSSSLSAVTFYAALGYTEQSRQFFGAEETVVMTKTVPVQST